MLNRSLVPVAAVALMLGATPLLAATDAVPTLNVAATCRDRPADGIKFDTALCLKSEDEARTKLAQQWGSFPVADRGLCEQTATMGGTASYVELLTCLQLRRDARDLPKDGLTRIGKRP